MGVAVLAGAFPDLGWRACASRRAVSSGSPLCGRPVAHRTGGTAAAEGFTIGGQSGIFSLTVGGQCPASRAKVAQG